MKETEARLELLRSIVQYCEVLRKQTLDEAKTTITQTPSAQLKTGSHVDLADNFSKQINPHQMYTLRGLLKLVPMSRSKVYTEIEKGKLHRTKMGKSTLFRHEDITAWLNGIPHSSKSR